jgi:hypothetical protein
LSDFHCEEERRSDQVAASKLSLSKFETNQKKNYPSPFSYFIELNMNRAKLIISWCYAYDRTSQETYVGTSAWEDQCRIGDEESSIRTEKKRKSSSERRDPGTTCHDAMMPTWAPNHHCRCFRINQTSHRDLHFFSSQKHKGFNRNEKLQVVSTFYYFISHWSAVHSEQSFQSLQACSPQFRQGEAQVG